MTDDKVAVDWFYRTTIKDPLDSIADIAAEANVSEDVVRLAIKDVVRLLSLVNLTHAKTDDLLH